MKRQSTTLSPGGKKLDAEEPHFTIVEAYYNNPGDETPTSWMVGDSAPFGETLDELKADMKRMAQALDRPVLIESELEK